MNERDDGDSDPDIEAMRCLALGDDLALNEIMDRWTTRVASYLSRLIGNQQDAMDLTQETFVAIYRARAKYRPSARFSTWLFGIASNQARQRLRWRKRHPEVALELEWEAASSGQPNLLSEQTPWHDLQAAERAALVRGAVLSLPSDLREVIVLFEFEGLPQKEIAEILHCTQKAVETRLYRARQLLRKQLHRHR